MTEHHVPRGRGWLAALAVAATVAVVSGCSSGPPTPAPSGTPTAATAEASPAASPTSAAATSSQELRDVRYCEVIPSVQKGSTVTTSVYNTLSYSNCPRAKWDQLTEAEVNKEFGSQKAQLNGPRYFVMDHAQSTGSATQQRQDLHLRRPEDGAAGDTDHPGRAADRGPADLRRQQGGAGHDLHLRRREASIRADDAGRPRVRDAVLFADRGPKAQLPGPAAGWPPC